MIIVCTFFILSKLQQKRRVVALQYNRQLFLSWMPTNHAFTMSIWILTSWWNSAHKHTHTHRHTIAFTCTRNRRHIIFVWAIPFNEWMLLLFRMLPLSCISWIYVLTHTHTHLQHRGCAPTQSPCVGGYVCWCSIVRQ